MARASALTSHRLRWLFFGVVLCATAMLGGCDRPTAAVQLAGDTMGTRWHVSYVPAAQGPGEAQVQAAVGDVLDGINASMSTYDPASEISTINRSARQRSATVTVSEPFATVLEAALTVHGATGGRYDVTVEPLVSLWGFGPGERRDSAPPQSAIEVARRAVGLQRLGWDREQRRLTVPEGMSLDFSSLAKGYAVDRVLERLEELGLRQLLVEIGGEVRALGMSPRGDPWRIGVERPGPGGGSPAAAITLVDEAVATSGDYRNFFEVDGRRYSHMIDPLTGYPIEHELVSVTVVHDSCMLADAWATALAVAGTERARSLAERYNLPVYLLSRSARAAAGPFESHQSSAFAARAAQRDS